MPVVPTMRPRALRSVAVTAVAALLVAALSGCESTALTGDGTTDGTTGVGQEQSERSTPAVTLAANVEARAENVPVSTLVRVTAAEGTLTAVRLSSTEAQVPGRMRRQGSRWVAQDRLEPGTRYRLRVTGENAEGESRREVRHFTTEELTLDEQTYPSMAPLDGETVGVGMPVIIKFDIPVTDRAKIEKHLTVRSTPRQRGSWHWVDGSEVHWRPKSYWQPGTEVVVEADINGVPAGDGIYGQMDRTIDFTVGERHVYRANLDTHQMSVFVGGEQVRTLPFSAGKSGFITRSGTKVIMSKHRTYDMNSGSIGIDPDSAEGYDLENVEYAMRLTHSGEFIHAAPWSVASHGEANVSHGCTGLSTPRAGWLFDLSRRGDVVEFTGSERPMTLHNGWGDWNASFAEYRQGSALH